MNILLTHKPGGAYGFITEGWQNALRDKGHKVQRWDGNETTWFNFKPDIYISSSGHKQPIPPKRNCKIAIHVNPYGPVKIPNINETDENIRWVLNQKPDCVFGYGTETDKLLWSYWTDKHNIPWAPMPTAGDRILYKSITPDNKRPNDIIYLGGYWPYKGITINSYLIPVISNKELKCKVHGWGDWPNNLCSGALSDDQVTQFLNSGHIGPCISEQHTHDHGIDIPERAFKIALCGALIIHDAVPSLNALIPSAIICSNAKNFHDACLHYSQAHDERIKLIEKQRQEVLNNHTYHHRMSTLFATLNLETESQNMLL